MCHDGTWETSLKMMLRALIFDFQVISLANKPGKLWPFCSKQMVESYQYPHCKLMQIENPILLYYHALYDPLKLQSDNSYLNHFVFLMQYDLSHSNTTYLLRR